MKPFDTYHGGKGADGTFQTIINHIPPHDIFISGFLGNCAIMRMKRPAEMNIGVDVDTNVSDAWATAMQANPEEQLRLTMLNESFFDYIERVMNWINDRNVFIYLDPPYLMDTRKQKHDVYNYELTTKDHIRLLELANKITCPVMISCYDNDLYRKHLANWNKHSFQGKTRAGAVTETIYMNYKLNGELHDYQYAGENFTERQRIKRKVKRTVDKLKRLPDVERNAILNELANSFA